MFSELHTSRLHRDIMASRLTDVKSSEIVLKVFDKKHDFGQSLFRKILSKSILKPGSIHVE